EDGIRDFHVTGVQTCALPISLLPWNKYLSTLLDKYLFQGYSAGVRVEVIRQVWLYTTLGKSNRSGDPTASLNQLYGVTFGRVPRSEERRVGKECRSRWSAEDG